MVQSPERPLLRAAVASWPVPVPPSWALSDALTAQQPSCHGAAERSPLSAEPELVHVFAQESPNPPAAQAKPPQLSSLLPDSSPTRLTPALSAPKSHIFFILKGKKEPQT